jgi:hypothetical protein
MGSTWLKGAEISFPTVSNRKNWQMNSTSPVVPGSKFMVSVGTAPA